MFGATFITLLTFAFLLSGISNDVLNLTHVAMFSSLAVGFAAILRSGNKLKAPPNFFPLLFFTLILNLYWLFSTNKTNPFYYSLLFTEGVALWFIAYNLEDKIAKNLPLFFLVPVFIYAVFYAVSIVLNINLTQLANLYFMVGQGASHSQIGALAAASVAYLAGSALSGYPVAFDLALYVIGIFFLFISKSRSAVLGLLTAVLYGYRNNKTAKAFLYIAVPLLIVFVFYISVGRTLLGSRVYFAQSILGFTRNLLGVGMGNFGEISLGFYNAGGTLGYFAGTTHNIFLEALTGAGILSIPFFYWGYKTVIGLFRLKTVKKLGWMSVFVAVSVIFMVDYTYTIAGMFWLWFASLGIAQKESES
jgi:hypothetical protein